MPRPEGELLANVILQILHRERAAGLPATSFSALLDLVGSGRRKAEVHHTVQQLLLAGLVEVYLAQPLVLQLTPAGVQACARRTPVNPAYLPQRDEPDLPERTLLLH
jgi:hypothetical protein